MLTERGVKIAEDEDSSNPDFFVEVTIDRKTSTPCIITSYSIGGESAINHAILHPIGLDEMMSSSTLGSVAEQLRCAKVSLNSLKHILLALVGIFFEKEAFSLTVRLSRNAKGEFAVARSDYIFDDAAIRSGKRQENLQAMRDISTEVPEEVEAERDGIVYMK